MIATNLSAGWIDKAFVWLSDGPIRVPGALIWSAYAVFVAGLLWLLSRKGIEATSNAEAAGGPVVFEGVNVDMARLEQELLGDKPSSDLGGRIMTNSRKGDSEARLT
jgi:hypothetical protein